MNHEVDKSPSQRAVPPGHHQQHASALVWRMPTWSKPDPYRIAHPQTPAAKSISIRKSPSRNNYRLTNEATSSWVNPRLNGTRGIEAATHRLRPLMIRPRPPSLRRHRLVPAKPTTWRPHCRNLMFANHSPRRVSRCSRRAERCRPRSHRDRANARAPSRRCSARRWSASSRTWECRSASHSLTALSFCSATRKATMSIPVVGFLVSAAHGSPESGHPAPCGARRVWTQSGP